MLETIPKEGRVGPCCQKPSPRLRVKRTSRSFYGPQAQAVTSAADDVTPSTQCGLINNLVAFARPNAEGSKGLSSWFRTPYAGNLLMDGRLYAAWDGISIPLYCTISDRAATPQDTLRVPVSRFSAQKGNADSEPSPRTPADAAVLQGKASPCPQDLISLAMETDQG